MKGDDNFVGNNTQETKSIFDNKNENANLIVAPQVPTGIVPNTASPVAPQPESSDAGDAKRKLWGRILNWSLIAVGAVSLFVIGAISLRLITGDVSIADVLKGRPDRNGTRTMMIYMVGSNLESDWLQGGMATMDLEEMMESGVGEDVNVVVYAGGAKNWKNGWNNGEVYELDGGEFTRVEKLGAKNTGEPKTLRVFIDYVYENYTTDLYDLVFWDHGAGPLLGFGSDELYEDDIFDAPAMLSIDDIAGALAETKLVEDGKKFEMVGFDACLMASAEIAARLSEYADWLVASQETEPGYGWDYNFLASIDKTTKSQEFGKEIVDTYYDFYESLAEMFYDADFGTTLSLVDLTKMDKLVEEIDVLFGDVKNVLGDGGYSKVVSKITKAQFFGDSSFDLIDLYGVAKQLETDYVVGAKALALAVENAVVYQKTNIRGANGLSIYYPYYTKSVLNEFLPIYDELKFSEEYNSFLARYSKILAGDRVANWSLRSFVPTVKDGKLSVNLGEDVVKDFDRAYYVIFAGVEGGRWTPVFRSSDVDMQGNGELTANFNEKQFVVTGDGVEGKYAWVSMMEYRREEGVTVYRIPAMLFNKEGFKFKSIYIEYKVDNNTLAGEISGYVPMVSVDELAGAREVIDLSKWDTISFSNFSYKIFDDAGKYTDDWEGGGAIFGSEFRTGEDIGIQLKDLDGDREYYCLFQVYDTQNNGYFTNLVKL